jgi:hypothetical protein
MAKGYDTTFTGQEDSQKSHETDDPDVKSVLCQITFSSVLHAVFYTV